jgi:serine/threonine protein kinase
MEGASKLAYHTNSARGTVCYRAPELVSGTKAIVSMKSDIWALGCIMYELLSGFRAFQEEGQVRGYLYSPLELDDPPLPDELYAQAKAYVKILHENTLAGDWHMRPTADEVLTLLNSNGADWTQVYLIEGSNLVGDQIGLSPSSDKWKNVRWRRYWS